MLLIDTHVLVWLVVQPRRLSQRAAVALRSARTSGGLGIAAISLWEMAMLIAYGRLAVAETPERWIEQVVEKSGVVVHPITPAIAALATQFPEGFPKDPADRLVAATARVLGASLVTADRDLRRSPLVNTVW